MLKRCFMLCRSFEHLSCCAAVVTGRVTCSSKRQRSLQWRVHMLLWNDVTWSKPAFSTITSSWRSPHRYSRSKRLFHYCFRSVTSSVSNILLSWSSWCMKNSYYTGWNILPVDYVSMSVGHLVYILFIVYSPMEHVTWKSPSPTYGWVGRNLHPDSCISGSSWSKVTLLSIWFVTVLPYWPLLICPYSTAASGLITF